MALTEGDKIKIRNLIIDSKNLIDYCYIRLGDRLSEERHLELIEYFAELEQYEKCGVIKMKLK